MSILINISTILNEVNILDYDVTTNEVYLDYHGKIGQPLGISREAELALSDPTCALRFTVISGQTKYYTFADVFDIQLDGVSLGITDWQDMFNQIGSYLFTYQTGGGPCPSSSILGIHFQHNKAHRQFFRCPADMLVTSVSTVNISAYKIWVNDILVTPIAGILILTQGDRIFAEVVHSGMGNGQINLTCTGILNPITYNSQDYYYPRTMIHKENVDTYSDYMLYTDQAIKGKGSTTSFETNAVWGDPVKNAFEMIYEPSHWNFTGQLTFGLNDLSLPYNTANRYPRMRYCIMLSANDVRVYEYGVLKTTVTVPYNQMFSWRIMSKENPAGSGIYTIAYWYSTNDEATWTLLYSSTLNQNGLDLYPDWATQQGYYCKHHPPKLSYV